MSPAERMAPPPPDDDDEDVTVGREQVERDQRRRREEERRAKAASKDRRSWYASKTSADALAAAVDDLYFATRRPKHEIISALFEEAVKQAPKVQRQLSKQQPHKA